MAFLNGITLPSGSNYDLTGTILTVVGTQTSNTAAWTGVIPVNALEDGTTIAYFLPRNSSSNVTLKLTLDTGTDTDAIPVYFQGNTRMGTQYSAGSVVILSYFSAGSVSIGGTAISDNRWQSISFTNSDTNVTQTKVTTQTSDYDLLMSVTASGGATKTEGALKDPNLKYNPSTSTLTTTNISATTINDVTVGNNPKFTDTTYTGSNGITIDNSNVVKHSNTSITAKATQGVYPISFDSYGHITGSGTAYTIGEAASKGVDTSISLGSTSTNLPTSKAVSDLIQSLDSPMIFKGTVGDATEDPVPTMIWTNLPSAAASNKGWSYKVVSAHGTDPVCDKGDMIVSNGASWVVIPSGDEPTGTVTSVAIGAGNTGVTVSGGPIITSGTLTVSHADTSSASSVVATTGQVIDGMTVDDFGHVTAISTATVETTDENVKQSPKTDNKDYRVLLSGSANDTEETKGINKNTNLKYNPSTQSLSVVKINGVAVGVSPEFTDTETTVSYNKTNGAGTFKQTVDGTDTTIFTSTDKLIGSASGWSAGTPGQTYSVSGKRLIISNGSSATLTLEEKNVSLVEKAT